jgi:hypothetical protein
LKESFEQRLTGGHPNSLGNTLEVVDEVLADASQLEALYLCYFSTDEVVRLRTSNAIKRISKEHADWFIPYLDRFITDISRIDQASTQWTLAILFDMWEGYFSTAQKKQATSILKTNLRDHSDWIVLNNTMETLSKWSSKDSTLKKWIRPHLERLQSDPRKSVAGRAKKKWAELL